MLGDKDTSFTSGCLCICLGGLSLTHARLGITELLKTETYFGHAFCLFFSNSATRTSEFRY